MKAKAIAKGYTVFADKVVVFEAGVATEWLTQLKQRLQRTPNG